ncbi:hypothetical protein [Mucilaginibacter sp. dw_454]|uniref:hypothetical protein n=1 Tax=Mucilaginibacter sp. dw_454 TaxID=2720079 RepID=UPI001BD57614|nr:hypothetical protein [Mucilaginibacter sp. dw_454]
MKKSASIIKTKSNYWIYSQSKTTDGVWIASVPFFKSPLNVLFSELIEKLFSALDKSGNVVPHPKDLKLFDEFFSKNLEIKSKKAFYSGAKCCEVAQDNDEISLLPTINIGNKGRFDHLPSSEIVVSCLDDNQVIYDAVQEAFDKCG